MQQWPFKPLEFETLPEAEMQQRALAFYQQISRRRSVREFSDRAVPRDIIENAIRAAGSAPSGANMHKPFLESAPWLIAVFLKKFTTDAAGQRHKNYYTAESVGIACGFLLAALHWSGLATLTHTPSPMKFLGEVLERPESERPFILIVTGYPAAGATVPDIGKEPLERIANFLD
jgi:iodotyrosine deiodinase